MRSRSSHSAPPTKIRFYGNNGFNILSAGIILKVGVASLVINAQYLHAELSWVVETCYVDSSEPKITMTFPFIEVFCKAAKL